MTATDLSDPSYWYDDASRSDQVAAAVEALVGEGYRIFVEVGSASLFSERVNKLLLPHTGVCLRSLGCRGEDWEQMIATLGALYARGVNIDWDSFYRHHAGCKIAMPTYPFAPRKYWLARRESEDELHASSAPKLWGTVTAGADQQSRQMPVDLALHTYEAKWRSLDQLATEYMMRTLRELAAFTSARKLHGADTLMESCAIVPTYRLLMERWLKNLVAEDLLKHEGGNYFPIDCGHEPTLEALRSAAKKQLVDIPFIWEYLERCGAMAAAVLTGKGSALETLFPAGSTDFAEQLYEQWSYSRYFNGIVRAAVEALVRSLPQGRAIRCLEIGAGTAAPPRRFFQSCLQIVQCIASPMSRNFSFARAAEKFCDYPFVRYGVLDAEKNPAEQGYRERDFDIVVAANVLHATRDVRASVKRLMSLLAPNGILILYEVTRPRAWFDISTALIEGWQVFNDGLRLDNPLLSREQWHEILEAAGFADVQSYPETHSPAQVLGAHVFLACMPATQEGERRANAVAVEKKFAARLVEAAPTGAHGEVGEAQDAGTFKETRRGGAIGTPRYTRQLCARPRGQSSPSRGLRSDRKPTAFDGLGNRFVDGGPAQKSLGDRVGLETISASDLDFQLSDRRGYRRLPGKANFRRGRRLGTGGKIGSEEAAAKLARLSDDQVADMLLKKLQEP